MQTFPAVYKGMSDCLIQTFKKDGVIRGLYAGTLPSIAANVAENSILFAGNTIFRVWLSHVILKLMCMCVPFGHDFLLLLFFFQKVTARAKNLSQILKATKALMNFRRWGKFNYTSNLIKQPGVAEFYRQSDYEMLTRDWFAFVQFVAMQWLAWLLHFFHHSHCARRNWWSVNCNRCEKLRYWLNILYLI